MHVAACVASLCVVLLLSPAGGSARPLASAEIVWVEHGVFAANADGCSTRRLLPAVADQHFGPAWSPDGETLVFSGRNSDQADLYVYDAPSATHRVLGVSGRWASPRRGRGFSYLLDASWAPDGRRLAVTDAWTPVESTVKVVSLGDRRLRPLTAPRRSRSDSLPAWSPDGRTIAFVRRHWKRWVPVVLTARPDGSGLRRLTRGTSPSWSPDGRRLVFAWGSSIYRVDADGSNRIRLARGLNARGDALQPRWSPDGRSILYLSLRGMWTMQPDGTHRTRIVRAREIVGGAGWRP
jgi:Tol biopolymer transport system component